MRRKWGAILRTVMVTAVTVAVVSATGAVAANKIDGKDIENNSITSKDVKNLKLKDFKKKVRNKIRQGGEQGPQGEQGPEGPPGPATPGAAAVYQNPEWSIMLRNTIGSGVAELSGGPIGTFEAAGTGDTEHINPPYGDGSLVMQVSDTATGSNSSEKVTFGNETEFLGDPVSGLSEVGFHVFQTRENRNISAGNMPNISFEIDPNLDPGTSTSNYTSMVFVPEGIPADEVNRWSDYIDATDTGGWYFTNGTVNGTAGCDDGDRCTLGEAQAGLADGGDEAIIYTAAVGKGRDDAWAGAVDGFRINETIYDFEPFGVAEVPAE